MRNPFHEEPLLRHIEATVPGRAVRIEDDPLNAFLQSRPFHDSLPRRVGFWTTTDRNKRPPIRVGEQTVSQEPVQRDTARMQHQVETALYERVQSLKEVVEDIEQTIPQLPYDVQQALTAPLANLYTQLSGLIYFAWIFAQIHPQADDNDP